MASPEPDLSLRHRTFGESVQLAVNVLRAQLVPLCGALAFLVVPLQLLKLIRTCFAPDMDMDMDMQPHKPSGAESRQMVVFSVISFVYSLVALAAAAAMWPVCVHVVSCHFLKEAASTKSAIQASGRVVLRVIATSFAALLALLGIFLLMFIIILAMTAGPFKLLFASAVQQAMDVSQPILRLPSERDSSSSGPDAKPTGDFSALGFVVTILLLLFSVAAFIFLYMQWSFANIVACMEPHYWGFSALWRSKRLSKGLLGEIFLAYIMLWAIGSPYRFIGRMLELGQMTFDESPSSHWGLLPLIITGTAVVMALHVLLQASMSILFTILYFSGRALHDNKEGSNSFNENSLSSFVHGGMEIDAGTELGYRAVKPEEEKLMPPGSLPE